MKWILWGVVAVLALGLAGFAGWIAILPPAPGAIAAEPVPQAEAEAILAALKPPKRQRPVVAVIGINDATETTDYILPTGVLRRADVADVFLVATQAGPVDLFPALAVEPDRTVAAFDAEHPEGADYVIVPAMSRDDDPAVMRWLNEQARKGAIVIGVCAGAKVVASAGLLDGKRGTTHWYSVGEIQDIAPTMTYVPDRRFVVDGRVATTTGITASIPLALTLIEAITGRAKAEAVAGEIGLSDWDATHASAAFRFNRDFATTVLANVIAFWRSETLALPLEPGFDEVSLALTADAWSRTYRSQAVTLAAAPGAVASRNGMRILPDEVAGEWPAGSRLPPVGGEAPAKALDGTLQAIAARYGASTASVVAMQLEYPVISAP